MGENGGYSGFSGVAYWPKPAPFTCEVCRILQPYANRQFETRHDVTLAGVPISFCLRLGGSVLGNDGATMVCAGCYDSALELLDFKKGAK